MCGWPRSALPRPTSSPATDSGPTWSPIRTGRKPWRQRYRARPRAEQLRGAGGTVDQVVVYSSTDVRSPDPDVAGALSAGRIDWVTVTSSAIARSLVRLFGDPLSQAKLASISPITSGVLRQLGYEPAVEAARYTTDGLVEAMVGFGGEAAPQRATQGGGR